ncbi:hypothetical protein [Wolbachia endosymbiont (group E) of Neria commutata]
MKNLAEWRENVVQFLSSRKKYRVFGPTDPLRKGRKQVKNIKKRIK